MQPVQPAQSMNTKINKKELPRFMLGDTPEVHSIRSFLEFPKPGSAPFVMGSENPRQVRAGAMLSPSQNRMKTMKLQENLEQGHA